MSRLDLIDWLDRNRPDLSRELLRAPGGWSEIRDILNRVTGLSVLSTDLIDESCGKWLAALIEISKQTPPGATDNRTKH